MNNSNTFLLAKSFSAKYHSASYEEILEKELRSIFLNSSDSTFDDVIANSYGAFPVDVVRKLKQIKLPIKEHSSSISTIYSNDSILPPPHLANYEWRFSLDSIRAFITKIEKEISGRQANICCLGTPTLAIELIKQGVHANILLLDINEPLITIISDDNSLKNSGTFEVYDARNPLPEKYINKFDFVFSDPPWYLDFYTLFITRACNLLKPNDGILVIPLFPILSRQHSLPDLFQLDKFLNQISYNNCTIEHLLDVNFDTPPFELETFIANDCLIPKKNWRQAEIVMIKFPCFNETILHRNIEVSDKTPWIRQYNSTSNSYFVINPDMFYPANITKHYYQKTLTTISRKSISNEHIIFWNHLNQIVVEGEYYEQS